MKCFPATPKDNERCIMRLELDGNDVELLEYAAEALGKLALIEDVLGVKGFVSPFITGEDLPTETISAALLVSRIVDGWDSGG